MPLHQYARFLLIPLTLSCMHCLLAQRSSGLKWAGSRQVYNPRLHVWDWAALGWDPAPNQQDTAVYLHTQQKGATSSIHAAKTASELIQAPMGSLHCFFRRPSWYSNDPLHGGTKAEQKVVGKRAQSGQKRRRVDKERHVVPPLKQCNHWCWRSQFGLMVMEHWTQFVLRQTCGYIVKGKRSDSYIAQLTR